MVSGTTTTTWATPLGPYSSIPAPGQQVHVHYEGGDVSKPMWIWNEQITSGTTGTKVTYSVSAPESPDVGDIWYPIVTANGTTTTGAAQVWTYTPPSTYAWVSQGSAPTSTYSQSTAPTGDIATGSTWVDTSTGNTLNVYNGSSWEPLPVSEINGATQLLPGSVTTGILGENAVTNFNVANNAITTTNIQPNSISTPLLQAGAVTANELVAGIVVAGIVDTTEIDSATFRGPDYLINTSGIVFYQNPI